MKSVLKDTERYIEVFAAWKVATAALQAAYARGDKEAARELGKVLMQISQNLDAARLHSWAQEVRNEFVKTTLQNAERNRAS